MPTILAVAFCITKGIGLLRNFQGIEVRRFYYCRSSKFSVVPTHM